MEWKYTPNFISPKLLLILMTNCSLPTYIFFLLASYFVSASAATQFCPELLYVKISCMRIAQNQTFDVQLSISTIKSSVQFFNDILFIRRYMNSITRLPSMEWTLNSNPVIVTPKVFQNDNQKFQIILEKALMPAPHPKRYMQCYIKLWAKQMLNPFIAILSGLLSAIILQLIQRITQLLHHQLQDILILF
ncbi:Hypothetical_protein [Hexamita inflata]|uniref:Hypothetical_protein n=1 Tax=Hexamita inflata TaxID=28002 RepID=A0ABP1HP93_9EUKA